MQVRYQAAPRSDTENDTPIRRRAALTPQQLQDFLEFEPELAHDLLALAHVGARLLACQLVARAADREALLVEQASDLADHDHILALVVAAISAALDRLQLRELLFPIAQYVRLDPAQIAYFTNREIALAGNGWQRVVILWLQHRPRPELSISVLDGTSRRGGR